jgi:hypothetical protein
MFWRLGSAIFRETKVLLQKLFVCYVIRAEHVKVGTYAAAYTQFRRNHFGLPEDGAPEARNIYERVDILNI